MLASILPIAFAVLLGLKLLLMAGFLGIGAVMNVPQFPQTEGGMEDLHYVVVTPGTAVTLPVGGLHLIAVQLDGAAGGAGAVTLNYAGGPIAHFPVAKSSFQEWLVDWVIPKGGTTIGAALTATEGTAPGRVVFVFSSQAFPGAPDIDWYRAIFFTASPAGANVFPAIAAFAAGTYDQGPACPTGVVGTTSAGFAEFAWPTVGSTTGGWACLQFGSSIGMAEIRPAPRGIKSANTLTPGFTNSAAATILTWVFYKPMPSGSKL